MISSGVEALDGRIGGLVPGGTYAFYGPAGAGKSILGLHFLLSGLERGERCALITREEPASIDSRAAYIGHGPNRLTSHPLLRLIQLPDHLPGDPAAAASATLAGWLKQQTGSERPSRLVVDSVEFIAGYSESPRGVLQELTRFLARIGTTTYVMVGTDRDGSFDRATYDPILQRALGAFMLEISERGQRTLHFQSPPPGTFRADPLPYALRAGGGFAEELTVGESVLAPEDRRRVIVIDEIGALAPDVLAQLEQHYELEQPGAADALGRLSSGRFGALVLVVDPFDENRAFNLAFALRKDGNGAPIVFAAPSRGLRSSTRSRGLRIGGDDFFIADLPTAEIVDRIQMAWLRGSHRRSGLSQIGQIMQPVNGSGLARPMTNGEFGEAVSRLLAEDPPLFFCYLEFTLNEPVLDLIWPALRARVRIGDGDIIAALSDRRVACVLDRITPEQTARVVDRIKSAHPVLEAMTNVTVIPSPLEHASIRDHLRLADAPPQAATT